MCPNSAPNAQADQHAAGPAPGPPAADVDVSKPIIAQVGRLGCRYEAWVHSPVTGTPRFFASPIAEALTRTTWWVVPLLWGPALTAGLVFCFLQPLTAGDSAAVAWIAACIAVGLLLWQLAEYSLHRWAFHTIPVRPWHIALHFGLHGCHHKFPTDAGRLVFPPAPAAAISAGVWSLLRLLLPQAAALPVFVGFVAGYLAYDCLHCAMHARSAVLSRWRLLSRSRTTHMAHHYRDPDAGFGITSDLFDVVFGTRPAAAKSAAAVRRRRQLLAA